jgi:hypothetical protein
MITKAAYENAKQALLTVYNQVAPDGATQQEMVREVLHFEQDGMSMDETLLCIAESIRNLVKFQQR